MCILCVYRAGTLIQHDSQTEVEGGLYDFLPDQPKVIRTFLLLSFSFFYCPQQRLIVVITLLHFNVFSLGFIIFFFSMD